MNGNKTDNNNNNNIEIIRLTRISVSNNNATEKIK